MCDRKKCVVGNLEEFFVCVNLFEKKRVLQLKETLLTTTPTYGKLFYTLFDTLYA